ncbi:hypothetical protein HDU96_004458 [Phlyctochytrium bullatum]|nr:hypothetical protein HDU96_004458 [Phlyctochytrium bullatum]
MYACDVAKSNFNVAMPRAEEERFSNEITHGYAFYNMLAQINSSQATSSNPTDKDEIFRLIRSSVGFAKLDRLLLDVFVKWMQRTLLFRIKKAVGEIEIARWKDALGSLYVDQGFFDKALSLFIICLQKRRRILGEDHPSTLTSWSKVARLLEKQGHYNLAKPLYVDCLKREQLLLGLDHPNTFVSMNNLAGLYAKQRRFEKAKSLYVECLERRIRVLGRHHPTTLSSMNNLAALYVKMGLFEEAESLYVECLNRGRSVLGENHPNILGVMKNLAGLYERQGLIDKAEPLYIESLEKRRRIFGSDHPETRSANNSLNKLYEMQFEMAELSISTADPMSRSSLRSGPR